MELACPSCGTHFRVPEGALGPRGRKVRCGACGHVWRALPSEAGDAEVATAGAAAAPESTPSPAEEWRTDSARAVEEQVFADPGPGAPQDFGAALGEPPSDDFQAEAMPRRRGPRPMPEPAPGPRWGLLAGWLLFFLVIGGLAFGGWQFRQQIVAQVPEAKRVYDLLGVPLTVAGPPFVLDWKRAIRTEETGPTVTLSGQVINASEEPQMPPQLVVVLSDAAGQQIDSWAVELGGGPMASGEARDFSTKGPWPPQASEVSVRPLM